MFAKIHRNKFVRDRAPLSNDEFVSRVGARPELHRFIAASREAIARICRVPATLLYPDDAPESVVKLATFDWDDVSVAIELEDILGFAVGDDTPRFLGWRFFWRGKPGPRTVGEWCIRVAEHLQARHSETQIG